MSVTSKTNAMVAVVLPDSVGSYSYYLEEKNCCVNGCTTHYTDKLFQILRENKFNYKNANKKNCDAGGTIWYGEYSYIAAVKWEEFIANYNKYFDAGYDRRDNVGGYEIVKTIK